MVQTIRNVHTRELACSPEQAGALLDEVPGRESRVWPVDDWPPMLFDGPLGVGAKGGHGPIRYTCTAYAPGRTAEFTFAHSSWLPRGTHRFIVEPTSDPQVTRLRHELDIEAPPVAFIVWSVAIRWFHDAVLEQLLDRAQLAVGDTPAQPARWNRWVRLIRPAANRILRPA